MNENPYARLIQIMQEQGAKKNPPSMMLGQVVQGFPDLIIKFGRLQLEKNDFYISSNLLDNLEPGDTVASIPTVDRQYYIILAKVVRA